MSAKTKKYYKSNSSGISEAGLAFLIKWFDVENSIIKYDGPFFNEERAEDILRSYLKRGVCSWIIKYDD